MAQRVREYGQWARQQCAEGRLLAGEKLKSQELLIGGSSEGLAPEVVSQPISGYFVVVAPGLEGAVAVARSCPHLRHGGRITIRPIEPTG
jgi:hypothetical protein